jgi:hypothetical protein
MIVRSQDFEVLSEERLRQVSIYEISFKPIFVVGRSTSWNEGRAAVARK